jgi:hypothetical protein
MDLSSASRTISSYHGAGPWTRGRGGGPTAPVSVVCGTGTPGGMASTSAPAVGPVRLADALGWGSAALGAPMTFAPRRFLRAIGVEDDPKAVAWTLFVGVREYTATLNIVANRQRRIGIWSRVAGDTMDLALLAAAHRHRREDATRLARAGAVVGGLLALDLFTAVRLSQADGAFTTDGEGSTGAGVQHDTGGTSTRVRTAVTIRRPEDEVRQAYAEFGWSAFDAAALEASGEVRFAPAPGDRGTELHLDHDPGLGGVAALAAKAVGRAPDQQIEDELRRFKALVETGVVVRSETSPEGPSAARQIFHKRQPAQPVEGSG